MAGRMRTRRVAWIVGAWLIAVPGLGYARGGKSVPAAAPASDAPSAYYVVDQDSGTVLAEKEANKHWPPASMTKMMTVLIAMERVRDGSLSMDEPVHASAWASKIGGSQVYLAAGETFPLREMLKAIMIASANDAAMAVAEHIAGSGPAFVELMNARAKALGLADTTYASPHGLPPAPGQNIDLSSAHDLAVLGRELMHFPEVVAWAGTDTAGFRNDTLQMRNTNHLVRTYPGATGLKTGYHGQSGFCVTASATRNDLNIIAVVLGMPTKEGSFREAARLMNEAFANYRAVVGAKRGAKIGDVAVSGGDAESVQALATDDLRVLVKRGEDKGVTVEAHVPRLVSAPIRKQQPLGEIVVRRGTEEIGRVPVVADRDVAATGWFSWYWNRNVVTAATP